MPCVTPTDTATSYAKDAYDNSGDTFRDGTQAIAKKVQDNPLGALLVAGGIGFALALLMSRPAASPAAALALLRLSASARSSCPGRDARVKRRFAEPGPILCEVANLGSGSRTASRAAARPGHESELPHHLRRAPDVAGRTRDRRIGADCAAPAPVDAARGCGEPKPKKSRIDGVACAGCCGGGGFFGASFGGAIAAAAPGVPGAAAPPSGVVAATGVSPLACSRPTSRRGQT